MIRAARSGFVLVAVVAACGSATEEGAVFAPTNDCPAHACSAYAQVAQTAVCDAQGFCHVNAAPAYTLVISLPDTAAVAPGFTFAIASSDLKTTSTRCPLGQTCIVLPRLGRSGGTYVATSDVAVAVKRYLGNASDRTSLPAHATFRPLGPGATSFSRANDLGLPLPTIFADVISDLPLDPPPPGPGASAPIGWDASLPIGRYERTLQPDPPFSDSFPPEIDIVSITGRPFQQVDLTKVDPPALRTFTIDSEGQDLTGWTAQLDDNATHRPISSVATLHSGSNEVTLHTVNRESLQGAPVEFVLKPRASLAAVPEMVVPAAPTIPKNLRYPTIPAPGVVAGRVVASPEGTPVRGRVFFRSTAEPGLINSLGVLLRYSVDVLTDAEGRYAVRLPAGTYDAVVVPEDGTGYGVAVSQAKITEAAFQQGRNLQVVRQPLLQGTVRLADGRALANADVEAHASNQIDPPSPNAAMQRVARGRTDANGAFSMRVDPGFYDVTIKPGEGSRFPWLITIARRVEDRDLLLEDQVVRVPFDAGLTLFDPTGSSVIRGALVRAYALPESTPGVVRRNFVEIGRARSSGDGSYEMFFSPTPPR
jgi:hypothetical protein